MAEVIGLAATISLTLYDFVGTVRYAKDELNASAIEASDLSTVLDHLSAVINQNTDRIISKTIETIKTLIKRCKRILEQFDVTIDLVKARATHVKWLLRKKKTREMKLSLESFKSTLSLIIQTVILGKTMEDDSSRYALRISRNHGPGFDELTANRLGKSEPGHRSATARRNINLLRSAVLSNRSLFDKLREAEETAKHPEPDGTDSAAQESEASDAFRQELEKAIAPPKVEAAASKVLAHSTPLDPNIQLLRRYYDMRNDPLASTILDTSLPSSVTQTRMKNHDQPLGLLTNTSVVETSSDHRESSSEESQLLLSEWTGADQTLIKCYFEDAKISDEQESPSNSHIPQPSR